MPPELHDIRNVFVDESSQTNHDYLVLGGTLCRASHCDRLNGLFQEARLPELPHSELKWTKVSNAKLGAYKRYVDCFFDTVDCLPLEFHSLVIPMRGRDDVRFNNGSREIGFNKEIYQLLMKCGRLHKDCVFHVYPDQRETTASPNELRLILNRGIAKKGDRRDWPYRRVHFRKSEDEPLIQLSDIFAGGIAYQINKHHLAQGASKPKTELSNYILGRAGVRDPSKDTKTYGKFTIWHRQLRVSRF